MRSTRLKASTLAMSYLLNPEKVRGTVDALCKSDRKAPGYVGPMGVKVTAARLEARAYRNLKDYVGDMGETVAQAAQAGSCLVAFPELSGMLPFSFAPSFAGILKELRALPDDDLMLEENARTVVETVQGFVSEVFLNTMSRLARLHHILIAGGSLYVCEGGQVRNRQYLFAENGDVAGMQDKLFLSPLERRAGVVTGERLTPADTRMGPIALLTARESAQYEPFAIASSMGCALAVAGASPYGEDTAHARYRAQEHRLCVLAPGLAGGGDFGLTLDMPARLYAPRDLTRTRDGLLAEEAQERTLTARVDPQRAAAQLDLYCYDKNPGFYGALLG